MKIRLKDIIKMQHLEMDIFEDTTFKPIYDEIRELGYGVVYE